MSDKKECRSCKEKIFSGARWCPHCHRPQSLLRAILPPQAIAILAIALGGYWYLSYAAMESTMSQMQGGAIYEGGSQIEILDSSFSISEDGCEPCIYTIGTLKNTTETAWSNIHFQVTFLDADGNVIDVVNDDDSDFVLGPNSEGKFKISGKLSSDASEYRNHNIKITKASPDQGWY